MANRRALTQMTMDDLFRIGQLFVSLQWPTDDTRRSPFQGLFTRFCRMWSRLAPSERDLIMTITPFYTWMRTDELERRFTRTWEMAMANLPVGTQSLALINLPKAGSGGPKSHDVMLYLAKSHETMLRLGNISTSFHSSCRDYNGTHTTTVAFLDDYVGTGNSAAKAVARLRQRFSAANWNAIFIIALVAQSQAVAALEALGCTLVADTILARGIGDSDLPDKDEAYRIMDSIGARLGIDRSQRLGYGGSEGLVTMMRTPNNTFPVYWTTRKVRGRVWNAPFPRYTKRTSPDWDSENSMNPPLRTANSSRSSSFEQIKVLECVRDKRDPQVLEQYQIPFFRSLHYLESLLEHGKIAFQAGTLYLTPLGHRVLKEAATDRLQAGPEQTSATRPQVGRFADARAGEPPTEERKSLYVPKEVIE